MALERYPKMTLGASPALSMSAPSSPWKVSLGCELQPMLFESITNLHAQALVDHLQITIPNPISFQEALKVTFGIPVIAHCNLLNTFDESNDWAELRAVARQLRTLNPVHVVEHFTTFRTQVDREKHGVRFTPEILEASAEIQDRINRWQDLLGLPLCLENVPVAAHSRDYFELMLEIAAKTQCRIACDVPHFLLSVHSVGMSAEEIQALAIALDPLQLHVGGLTVSGGILRDNHKVFSPWIASQARALFPQARYVTLEQNHQILPNSVERYLREIRATSPSRDLPAQILEVQGIEQQPLNQELATDSAKNNGYAYPVRTIPLEKSVANAHPVTAIDLYEKYLPFLFPIESISQAMDDLAPIDAVQKVTSLSLWSLSYLSWWSPESEAAVEISYGEGSDRKFSRTIGTKNEASGGKRIFRFASKQGYWVEAAAPVIPEFSAVQKEGVTKRPKSNSKLRSLLLPNALAAELPARECNLLQLATE